MKLFGKKEEVVSPYAIEQCNQCKATTKRPFKLGDYIFKGLEQKCSSCKTGHITISKIFGEVIK